ncbi:MAG TPA: amidase [Symbiobacteriaceae bacterium]|nr:amidase [Symbiobacteriaceae bacterium]
MERRYAEATIPELSAAMAEGRLTSEELTLLYLERIATIDKQGPALNAVLEINPEALFIARALDQERRKTGPRGPLHGIPVLLKDNIDTGDKLHTSAGSLALATSYAPRDAFVAAQLRKAGAVILGKANMTEFANFMTEGMPSGYSSRGGQVINPYVRSLTPSGSSSGSAVAVAAGLCAVAVGTETSGSILSPAVNNSVVGIKPTVGLVSRTGIIPIAVSQDTAGPMARTVADAAALLGAMTGIDPADPATAVGAGRTHRDYTRFLDAGALRGARLGVPGGYLDSRLPDEEKRIFTAALEVLRAQGAELVESTELMVLGARGWRSKVLVYEFKPSLNAYLAALGPGAPVRSLREIINFNNQHPEATLKYGQTLLAASEETSGTLTEPEYIQSRLEDLRRAGTEGIDAAIERDRLDALVFPGPWGCWIGARAGYPSVTVPAGYMAGGEPMGVTFTGRAWTEPVLIGLAYAYEQATHHRVAPQL